MNTVQLVEFEGREIRMVERDGEPWWVARDVCDVLELTHISNALEGISERDLTVAVLQSGGQNREMKLINEPGLYRLIFKSRKQEALRFQDWVCREVLPAIRRDGVYVGGSDLGVELAEVNALELRCDALRLRIDAKKLEHRARLFEAIDGGVSVANWVRRAFPHLGANQVQNVVQAVRRYIKSQLKGRTGFVYVNGTKHVSAVPELIECAVGVLVSVRPELRMKQEELGLRDI